MKNRFHFLTICFLVASIFLIGTGCGGDDVKDAKDVKDANDWVGTGVRSRAQAAYWDGRNESGEPVASGVYFYHLRAGDYAALRRLVIVK